MSIFSKIGSAISKVVKPITSIASAIPGPWQVPAAIVGAASDIGSAIGGAAQGGAGSNINTAASIGNTLYGANAAKQFASAIAAQNEKGITALNRASGAAGDALTYGKDLGIDAVTRARDAAAGDLQYGAGMGEKYLAGNYQAAMPQYGREMQLVDNAYGQAESMGNQAGASIGALYGLNGPQAQAAAMEAFKSSPAYQYQLDQMNKATRNTAAAQGRFYTPDTVQALQRNAAGLASQEYGNYLGGLNALYAGGQQAAGNRLSLRNALFGQQMNLGDATARGIAGLYQQQGAGTADINQNYGRTIADLYNRYGTGIADTRLKTAGDIAQLYGNMGSAYGASKLLGANVVEKGVGDLVSSGGLNNIASSIGDLLGKFSFGSNQPVSVNYGTTSPIAGTVYGKSGMLGGRV